ncbi:hypothetical protein JOQ06_024098, partial [Pogonophryne albipinna]
QLFPLVPAPLDVGVPIFPVITSLNFTNTEPAGMLGEQREVYLGWQALPPSPCQWRQQH